MNKSILLILLLVLVGSAIGSSTKVLLLNLHYSDGDITLVNKEVKQGYYPDRKIQHEGYRLEFRDFSNEVLYSTSFKDPHIEYTDANEEGELTGGIIEHENIDFSLALPYYPETKKVRIYNERNKLLMDEVVQEKEILQSTHYYWIFGIIGVVLIALVLIIIKRRNG